MLLTHLVITLVLYFFSALMVRNFRCGVRKSDELLLWLFRIRESILWHSFSLGYWKTVHFNPLLVNFFPVSLPSQNDNCLSHRRMNMVFFRHFVCVCGVYFIFVCNFVFFILSWTRAQVHSSWRSVACVGCDISFVVFVGVIPFFMASQVNESTAVWLSKIYILWILSFLSLFVLRSYFFISSTMDFILNVHI